jgi:hypothetical protein
MYASCSTTPNERTTVTRTWHDVPDPRDDACPAGGKCDVVVEDHRWSHIDEHVNDLTEPWDDWLTPPLATALRNSLQVTTTETGRQTTRQQVSDRMEQAAKQAVGVPLVVLYDAAQPPKGGGKGSPWELTVDLVLPCGAKLCPREAKKVLGVRTCFFPSAVCAAPPNRRWRLLVRQLLTRYAKDNGDGTFSPPDPSAWPILSDSGEGINNPRFRTDAKWGLDGRLVDPWANLPDYWSPPTPPPTLPPPPPPPAAPPPALGPRVKY